jgi:hypothetical protein
MRVRGLFAMLALGAVVATAALAADEHPRISQLDWLIGKWLTVRPARKGAAPVQIQEEWHKARDATLMSLGSTTRGDTILDSELVVIREAGKHLMYEAHPRGQASAVFHSIEVTDSTCVFENPSHDFPRRIGYQRCGPDSLLAWIEGTQKGQRTRINFPYHRVK